MCFAFRGFVRFSNPLEHKDRWQSLMFAKGNIFQRFFLWFANAHMVPVIGKFLIVDYCITTPALQYQYISHTYIFLLGDLIQMATRRWFPLVLRSAKQAKWSQDQKAQEDKDSLALLRQVRDICFDAMHNFGSRP